MALTKGRGAPVRSAADAADAGVSGSTPGSRRSPGRRKWQPTPVFLPGEFCG